MQHPRSNDLEGSLEKTIAEVNIDTTPNGTEETIIEAWSQGPCEEDADNRPEQQDGDNKEEAGAQESGDFPPPEERLPQGIITCREKMFMRRDNYLYFITTEGEPCDEGARQLKMQNKLPKFKNLEIGVPAFIKVNSKIHIAMPLRGETIVGLTMINQIIESLCVNLIDLLESIEIQSISIEKTDRIENLEWNEVIKKLRIVFHRSNIKLIVCLGIIKFPLEEDKLDIIREAHCSVVGGHRGVTKTFKRIKQFFFWEKLKEDIQDFIRKCLGCQLKKLKRVKTKLPMVITESPACFMDRLAMDVVGPLPKTSRENQYILTFQDLLTKFVIAEPLDNTTAITVANVLIKKVICVFGAPRVILTDQGTNFLSKLLKRVAKRFRIKQVKTTAFHPQSNGSLERSHASLVDYIKFFVHSNKEDWDDFVDLATFNFNTSVSETTWHTPFELVYGRLARTPSEAELEPEDLLPTFEGYLTELATRLNSLQTAARENMLKAKLRSKVYYDQKAKEKTLQIGDSVWLVKGQKPHKFDDPKTGPYLVLDILPRGNVKIQINESKTKIVHANRLETFYVD